jgi:hypothetical protein
MFIILFTNGFHLTTQNQDIAVTTKYDAMWGYELREQNDKHYPLNSLDV